MFQALHQHLSGEFTLPLDIDSAYPLFTPAGETLWVPDWQPQYFHPADGHTVQGMVFATGHGGESTLWTLADHDPASHSYRYVRVTPGSRFVQVQVSCQALDAANTRVRSATPSPGSARPAMPPFASLPPATTPCWLNGAA